MSSTEDQNSRKLGVFMASVIAYGTTCGTPIIITPYIAASCGWLGFLMFASIGLLQYFAGLFVVKSWTMVQEKLLENDAERVTEPYPIIAYHACGKITEIVSKLFIGLTVFGLGIAFVIIISENLTSIITSVVYVKVKECYLIPIVSGILTPLTFFGTPKNMRVIGITASLTSCGAAILIICASLLDTNRHQPTYNPDLKVSSVLYSLGITMFACSMVYFTPTIQVDMREAKRMNLVILISLTAFMGTIFLVMGVCFAVYGTNIEPNILFTITPSWITYTATILITIHLTMAYPLLLNVISQGVEGYLGIPDSFNWKRIVVCLLLSLAVLVVALAIPHFDIILTLIGGSTLAVTGFVFPGVFYLLLFKKLDKMSPSDIKDHSVPRTSENTTNPFESGPENDPLLTSKSQSEPLLDNTDNNQMNVTSFEKVFIFLLCVVGIVGGLSITFSVLQSLITGREYFTLPCFVNGTYRFELT